jgi:mannose-6-phosphate isomerase-like protein (cupin superfamily)
MITIIDMSAELAKLKMLRGRTAASTAEQKKEAIVRLAPYRDGAIFASEFSGDSGWERHPQGDEIVQIVEGTTTLLLMTDAGPQSVTLSAGMLAIVPQGMWHRFLCQDGVTLVSATPQPTDHVDVEDPRTL